MIYKVISVLRIFDYAKAVEMCVGWPVFIMDREHRFTDSGRPILVGNIHTSSVETPLSSESWSKVFAPFSNIADYHRYLADNLPEL